ncbi:MAG: hypothetical protein ABIJ03_00475 [Patescibacteria group bacterium]
MSEDFNYRMCHEPFVSGEDDEQLFLYGSRVRKNNYSPKVKRVDGCAYDASCAFNQAVEERFGLHAILDEVRRLNGDINCANWHTWACLNLTDTLGPK